MSSHSYPLFFGQGFHLELPGLIKASSLICQTLPARPRNQVCYSGTVTLRGGWIAAGFTVDLVSVKLMALHTVSLSSVEAPHGTLLTRVGIAPFHFCSHLAIVQTHILAAVAF